MDSASPAMDPATSKQLPRKEKGKRGETHDFFFTSPSSPRPGSRQCNPVAAVLSRTQCQQRERPKPDTNKALGKAVGMTSRSNCCAGVWDSAGLAQWKDDTMAHREIQNPGHGITAGELSELGHLHQIQRSNKWNLAEDYFLISFSLFTNIWMLWKKGRQ